VKKRLLLAICVIFIISAVSAVFFVKKSNMPVRLKEGKITSISGLYNKAQELEVKGDLLEARSLYQTLINEFSGSGDIANWQKKIENLNIKLLFSSVITPKSTLYEIKPGDTLVKISKEFKTTVELIMKSNNLVSDKIVPGRKIKVWTSPFSMVVDKSDNTLILQSGDEVIQTYIVSTGANNCSPVGTFKIINKLPNPTWFKAGAVVPSDSPANILGSRWMGFDILGYGIHGTTEPKNLGKQVTQGCVRMSNSEVEELYAIVPVGTEVTIIN
jgi:lipoprotein-anchoring transpeptidase ErfK/SrfK